MQRDGLSVTEEPVMVPRWVRGAEHARLVSPRNKTLAMVGLGDSIGTGGKRIVAPVLVVSSFADLELRRNEAAGRIVVFNAPFVSYGETVEYRSGGAAAAAAAGGVAALVRSVTSFSLQTPHACTTEKASVPVAAITAEDAELLARMQRRGQEPVVELYMEARTLPDVQSRCGHVSFMLSVTLESTPVCRICGRSCEVETWSRIGFEMKFRISSGILQQKYVAARETQSASCSWLRSTGTRISALEIRLQRGCCSGDLVLSKSVKKGTFLSITRGKEIKCKVDWKFVSASGQPSKDMRRTTLGPDHQSLSTNLELSIPYFDPVGRLAGT